MSDEEAGNACRQRAWGRLAGKEVTGARKSHSRAVHQSRRKNVRLLQTKYLLAQRHRVAAERIERRGREVLTVVDGVDSPERVALRKNMVDTSGAEVFSNGLQWTAEHFGDSAIDRSGAGAGRRKVKVARARRGP